MKGAGLEDTMKVQKKSGSRNRGGRCNCAVKGGRRGGKVGPGGEKGG